MVLICVWLCVSDLSYLIEAFCTSHNAIVIFFYLFHWFLLPPKLLCGMIKIFFELHLHYPVPVKKTNVCFVQCGIVNVLKCEFDVQIGGVFVALDVVQLLQVKVLLLSLI